MSAPTKSVDVLIKEASDSIEQAIEELMAYADPDDKKIEKLKSASKMIDCMIDARESMNRLTYRVLEDAKCILIKAL